MARGMARHRRGASWVALALIASSPAWLAGPASGLGEAANTPAGRASARVPLAEPPGPPGQIGQAAPAFAGPGADRYIVVFHEGTTPAVAQAAEAATEALGGSIDEEFDTALTGFSGVVPDEAVVALRANPAVAFVEPDLPVSVAAETVTQTPVSWNLDRVDQASLPLDGAYHYTNTGKDVTAYVIDTGIRFSHGDFQGRAVTGFDVVDGGTADDCHGHGTHVAGIIGSATYGIAKGARLVGVRVLNCLGQGTMSQVIAGVEWVTENHQAGEAAVANVSLGGGISLALDSAVQASIADGVTYTLAAGNNTRDACEESPGRVAEAITVGSTNSSDVRAPNSNYGSCLDLFAPGASVLSTYWTADDASASMSGTSMASPHVAGVAARILQVDATATPSRVRDLVVKAAASGIVGDAGSGSPNLLLQSGVADSLVAEPVPAPTIPPPAPETCALRETFTGSLAGPGDYRVLPGGTFYVARAGVHRGCVTSPAGANFNLYLYRWNGSRWEVVASSTTTKVIDSLSYTGTGGYYFWVVSAAWGSGSYTMGLERPR